MNHRFFAYDVALEIARVLKEPLVTLKKKDAELFDQAYRALKSMGLNIAEGGRRAKKDRGYHFNIAAGSAQELRMALDLAAVLGLMDESLAAAADTLLDRELAMLWRLTHAR